ncbi:MAG: ACT domain-containing protein [Phycisphaerae bacterium]|nr:ACT domain-containing protein [Phycisphaerae bacterium]
MDQALPTHVVPNSISESTQFCVGLPNRPGSLAPLCRALREGGVNIEAICVADDQNCCWVNMICQPPDTARTVLSNAGYNFFAESVLTMRAHNQPGELERIANRLADAGINIEYVYGSGATIGTFTLVIGVADRERAVELLGA